MMPAASGPRSLGAIMLVTHWLPQAGGRCCYAAEKKQEKAGDQSFYPTRKRGLNGQTGGIVWEKLLDKLI